MPKKAKCQQCKSARVATMRAHTDNQCQWKGDGYNHSGDLPESVGLGKRNIIKFAYCLDCGQLQGDFPISMEPARKLQISGLEVEIDFLEAKVAQRGLREGAKEQYAVELQEAQKKLEGLQE